MDKVSPKFKKGDKLRCIRAQTPYLKIGQIYTAYSDSHFIKHGEEVVAVRGGKPGMFVTDYVDNFEKIQELENFQPGDMVECIDADACIGIVKGKIYKISEVHDDDSVFVEMQDKIMNRGPYLPERFKKIDNFTKQAIAAEEKYPLNSIGPLPEVYTQNGQVIIKIQGNVEILVPMGMTINLNTNGNKAWVCLIP
jgi:hypothetical protein